MFATRRITSILDQVLFSLRRAMIIRAQIAHCSPQILFRIWCFLVVQADISMTSRGSYVSLRRVHLSFPAR